MSDPAADAAVLVKAYAAVATAILGTAGLILSPLGRALRGIVSRADRQRDSEAAERSELFKRTEAATISSFNRADRDLERADKRNAELQTENDRLESLLITKDRELDMWRQRARAWETVYSVGKHAIANYTFRIDLMFAKYKPVFDSAGIDPIPYYTCPMPTQESICNLAAELERRQSNAKP